jgi:photosystem II stability/assembly factor-like uncharacterized protein
MVVSSVKAKVPSCGRECRWGHYWRSTRFLILLLTVVSLVGKATSANAAGYALTERDSLLGVTFLDAKVGYAVGKTGLVLRTTDGGKEWGKIDIGLRTSLNKVIFIGRQGWIVGNDGVLLHSSDGGEIWAKKDLGDKFARLALTDIAFATEKRGFIVAEMGEILKTVDGGSTWESVPTNWLDTMPEELTGKGIYALNLYDIFFLDDKEGWIVGDWGTVMHTTDSGEQWSILRMGLFPHLFAASFRDSQVGCAVGQNGTFLITCDGGVSWNSQPALDIEDSLFKVILRDKFGVAVGEQGLVLQTSDGGAHWSRAKTGDGVYCSLLSCTWFADVCFVPGSEPARYIAVGWPIKLDLTIKN